MKLKNRRTITSLYEKYPNFKNDFDMNWRNIVKKCLTEQYYRNSQSKRLTGIKERCKQIFGYLDESELKVVQERISDKFIQRIYEDDWNPWRDKLPEIFDKKQGDVKLDDNDFKIEKFIKLDENGIPNSIRQVAKEKTYTIVIRENIEDGNEFVCKTVPSDVAMTTISQLSSALA